MTPPARFPRAYWFELALGLIAILPAIPSQLDGWSLTDPKGFWGYIAGLAACGVAILVAKRIDGDNDKAETASLFAGLPAAVFEYSQAREAAKEQLGPTGPVGAPAIAAIDAADVVVQEAVQGATGASGPGGGVSWYEHLQEIYENQPARQLKRYLDESTSLMRQMARPGPLRSEEANTFAEELRRASDQLANRIAHDRLKINRPPD